MYEEGYFFFPYRIAIPIRIAVQKTLKIAMLAD